MNIGKINKKRACSRNSKTGALKMADVFNTSPLL